MLNNRFKTENLISNGTVTETSVEPLLKELIQAFHTAQTSVASLPHNQTDIEKRQDDIGTLIAEIIEVNHKYKLAPNLLNTLYII